MSRRGAYIGGHTIHRPSRSSKSDETVPRAAETAALDALNEARHRELLVADIVETQQRIFAVERRARAGELQLQEALLELADIDVSGRLAALEGRRQKYGHEFHPLFGIRGLEAHYHWLVRELNSPKPGFFDLLTRVVSNQPEVRSTLEIVKDEIERGLFAVSGVCSDPSTRALRLRFRVMNEVGKLKAGERLGTDLLRMLSICEQRANEAVAEPDIRKYQRQALDSIRSAYIEHLKWSGRGQAFKWI